MKNKLFGIFLAAGMLLCVESVKADSDWNYEPRQWQMIEIPEMADEDPNYEFIANVAHYKNADWSRLIGRKSGTTVDAAKKIADDHPEITYFFFVKGYNLVLETESNSMRCFDHGDAVFFSGTPWWGSAPGLADGYIKVNRESN